MERDEAFAYLLERLLKADWSERPAREARPAFVSAAPNPFLFTPPRFTGRPHAYSAPGIDESRPGHRTVPPARKAARTLRPGAQRALGALIGLGAVLREDFTAAELRSAFRALARQYHPDAHHDCSAAEQARLSRLFADMCRQYHLLLAAIAPLGPARH